MSSHYIVRAAARTDRGQIRAVNQDSVLALVRPPELGDARGLLVVADGMGGHQAGEIASHLAVETIRDALSWIAEADDVGHAETVPVQPIQIADTGSDEEYLKGQLRRAVKQANKAIYHYAQENPERAGNLGCTATCVLIYGKIAVVGNVGDSRTYRWHDGQLEQITADHSYVWQLISEGHLGSEEIFEHPQRNVITRALGSHPIVEVDVWSCELEEGDRLLLCSDGVWEMIRDHEELTHLLTLDGLEEAAQELVAAANAHGGTDNIGVVVAEIVSG